MTVYTNRNQVEQLLTSRIEIEVNVTQKWPESKETDLIILDDAFATHQQVTGSFMPILFFGVEPIGVVSSLR